MATLQTVKKDEAAVLEALERDGGVIVQDYVDAERVATVREDFLRALGPLPWGNSFDGIADEFFGAKTKRLHGVFKHSRAAEACFKHPFALSIARALLGKRVIFSTGELMAIGPGEERQALHRDGDTWYRAHFPDDILFSVNVALTDFRRENGATVVVPGSHLWTEPREPAEAELAFAEMPAGSALFYRGRLVHGGGASQADETRIGLYFGYIPAWVRQQENPAVSMPPALLAELDPEMRLLLGIHDDGFITVI